MNLLVLDTATDRCALACSVDGEVIENTRTIPRLHNEHLLSMLQELLASAGLAARDLTAIGFTAGPGSFTGIRISAAVTQALAVAADAQVVPLRSSYVLAAAAQHESPAANFNGVQTVLRSRRGFAYLAHFDQSLRCVSDDVLMEDQDIVELPLPQGISRVMDASSELASALGAQPVTPGIADLLALTKEALQRGEGLPPEGAQPRYVEGDTPWVPRAQ